MAQQGFRFGPREHAECRWRPSGLFEVKHGIYLSFSSSFFCFFSSHFMMSASTPIRFNVWCCEQKHYLPPALTDTLCLLYADCETLLSEFTVPSILILWFLGVYTSACRWLCMWLLWSKFQETKVDRTGALKMQLVDVHTSSWYSCATLSFSRALEQLT